MTLNELSQLDELRTAVKVLQFQVNAASIVLNKIKDDVDKAYYQACQQLKE